MKHIYPTGFTTLGFSLLEVFFSLTTLGILISVSLPYFPDFMARNRLSNQTDLLYKAISFSRLYAINHSNFITLCSLEKNECVKDSWHKELTAFVDYDKSQSRSSDEPIISTFALTPVQDSLVYPRLAITFRPDGSLNGLNNGTFRYCPNYKTASLKGLEISLSQAGRVRVISTNKCQT